MPAPRSITEEIKIDLAGTYRQITDWISTLSALLVSLQFNARHTLNALRLCYLEPDAAGAADYWFSPSNPPASPSTTTAWLSATLASSSSR